MAFHPYVFFGRNCREAFHAVPPIFGGKLVILPMKNRFGSEAGSGQERWDATILVTPSL